MKIMITSTFDKFFNNHGDYTFDLINDYLNTYFKILFIKDIFDSFDKIHNALITDHKETL